MGKAATGARERGFTLIEILAVLIIIGVVTTMAVISIRSLGGHNEQGQAAVRLAGLVELASDNARLENRQYGLLVKPTHYEFVRLENQHWIPVTDDPVLKGRDLPDGMTMTVTVQNPVNLPHPASAGASATAPQPAAASAPTRMDATRRSNEERLQPQVAILSTGEMTPFTLRLTLPDNTSYVVRGDGSGQVHIEAPNAASASAPTD